MELLAPLFFCVLANFFRGFVFGEACFFREFVPPARYRFFLHTGIPGTKRDPPILLRILPENYSAPPPFSACFSELNDITATLDPLSFFPFVYRTGGLEVRSLFPCPDQFVPPPPNTPPTLSPFVARPRLSFSLRS